MTIIVNVNRNLSCDKFGILTREFSNWMGTHFPFSWMVSAYDNEYLYIVITKYEYNIVELKLKFG